MTDTAQSRHDRRRRHVLGPRRRFTTLEILERCDDSRAGRSGLKVHLVQEGWQEQPHASVPRLQLGIVREHSIRRNVIALAPTGNPEALAGAVDSLRDCATPVSHSVVAEHRRRLPDGTHVCLPGCERRPWDIQTPKLRAAEPGSRSGNPDTVRVETGAVAQHCAGDVEQAVGHRAQGAGVSVAATS